MVGKWLRRLTPDLDDALLVPGAIGLSASIGWLFGPPLGLLAISLLALAGGVLVSLGGRRRP